jgi:hypothetical protein
LDELLGLVRDYIQGDMERGVRGAAYGMAGEGVSDLFMEDGRGGVLDCIAGY